MDDISGRMGRQSQQAQGFPNLAFCFNENGRKLLACLLPRAGNGACKAALESYQKFLSADRELLQEEVRLLRGHPDIP